MRRLSPFIAMNAWIAAALACASVGCGGSSGDAATSSSGATTGAGGGASSSSSGAGGTGGGASGSSGSSGTGGASAACKALFCEDFEGGKDIDPVKWKVDVGYDPGNMLAVDSAQVAHGSLAAHAHLVDTTGGFATLRESATFPALADELWGRAYFYTTVADGAGHTGFISAFVGDARVLEIGQSNGNWQLTYYEPGKEFPAGYNTKIPQSKWVCLEWHFTRSGPKLIEVYTDGALAVDYDASGHKPDALTAVSLGIDNHSPNPPGNDVYLDDIAIDAARIGCLP
jgi:hypothetical protein